MLYWTTNQGEKKKGIIYSHHYEQYFKMIKIQRQVVCPKPQMLSTKNKRQAHNTNIKIYLNATWIWCFKDDVCITWNHSSLNIIRIFPSLHSGLSDCKYVIVSMILKCCSLPRCHNLQTTKSHNLNTISK